MPPWGGGHCYSTFLAYKLKSFARSSIWVSLNLWRSYFLCTCSEKKKQTEIYYWEIINEIIWEYIYIHTESITISVGTGFVLINWYWERHASGWSGYILYTKTCGPKREKLMKYLTSYSTLFNKSCHQVMNGFIMEWLWQMKNAEA